ncbi:MAG TPA: UDP-4-amino-4,6-dideoxy-N-acetyl-beta-L-altrosamine transaminase [Rhizomicrobium sp.]|jgi:UDP-4-amino-4,6-dideoxy-N-acetyl-beta-L-altrosamine transaminase|nr:UDP-4-amino-4,6-dideoxy-N-acetyl-beta-L-altrosamine transaminase [Rhizomicrobium sp.]
MAFIPYGRQTISEEDIQAVTEVLRSDFLTQGPAVPAFEAAVMAHCGTRHAVAVNSATSALHIACLALGAGSGDLVWTSPITFVASANCALYCGADVDFVDIDPATLNMSVPALAAKLEQARKSGALPKIVIPVHLAGQSCDMAAIAALAKQYGFAVIEDASHAIGGRYQDHPLGDCRHSDITVFSFHPVKIITTGEGGMAVTNDAALAKKMALLRSHGITRDAADMVDPSEGGWGYQQVALGFNYRMTDIQAALGSSQIRLLEERVARRHVLAARYDKGLAALPLILPRPHADAYSAWHLYVIQLREDATIGRSQLFDSLRKDEIGVNVHYIPVHLQPHYRRFGFRPGELPAAEAYYARALSIPIYSAMTDDQQDFVMARLTHHCRRR